MQLTMYPLIERSFHRQIARSLILNYIETIIDIKQILKQVNILIYTILTFLDFRSWDNIIFVIDMQWHFCTKAKI